MKKTTLLVFFASLLFAINVNAQEKKSMINLRLGVGSSYTGSNFETNIPPIEGSYETFINDKITVGGFAGISSAEWKIPNVPNIDLSPSGPSVSYSTGQMDFTYMTFGGLANYYFVNEDSFQAYGGVKLGYVNVNAESSISGSVGSAFNKILSDSGSKTSGLAYSINAGGRYWFTDSIAVNAELGFGISTFGVGVTIGL